MNLLKNISNNLLNYIKKIFELEQKQIDEINECKCCFTDEYHDINLIRCSKITFENRHKICIECLLQKFK